MCQTFRDHSVIKRDLSVAGHLGFDRVELAGSPGDLGRILPLSIGMIVINGLDPLVLFACVGSCYFFPGVYFGVTMPVDPMKVIGAYAIASGIAAPRIFPPSWSMAVFSCRIEGLSNERRENPARR
jgi:SulP family sulfate permease